MSNPFQVVKDFEAALCEYTGAPYAVAVTSCTMALLLACAWQKYKNPKPEDRDAWNWIEIPKRTYIGVPMSIKHAGFNVVFRDGEWIGQYNLNPYPIWDSARWFTKGLFNYITASEVKLRNERVFDKYICTSFHWTKTLAIGQGGAILHDNPEADVWFRKARFDGRTEGVAPKDDTFNMLGWHCYMSPRDAAEGLSRLAVLPRHNNPLPSDDYPDLSKMEIFQ